MLEFDFLQDQLFLKELENFPIKEQRVKIELLDFKERPISEIEGKCTSGSINIDGSSSMRRTCTLSLIVDNSTYDLTNVDSLISINKKIRLSLGYTNFSEKYKHYGDIIWFPLGIYIIIAPSISHSVTNTAINITAKDKMCLLNGEVSGKLVAPVSLHEKYIRGENDTLIIKPVSMYDIIREAVIHLGGEDPTKVIINDIPLEAKKLLRYIGNKPVYFDENGNELAADDPSVVRTLSHGDLAGYDWVTFAYPGELIKQAGETVVSILDSIKNVLGNYEYFYDVDGNFIFQEMKNYLNTNYRPITELTTGDYVVNFGESHIAYSFKDSNIISSYSNTPNYLNIKNDFIVWGKRTTSSDAQVPIRYRICIDDIPTVPMVEPYIYIENGVTKTVPWQVYLYLYGKQAEENGLDPGYYYTELKNEIPKLYDFVNHKWLNTDPSVLDAYLDFIDSKSELGKFSINSIGRRPEVVTDDDVTTLYRPDIPDFVILDNSQDNTQIIQELTAKGQKWMKVNNRNAYTYAGIGKDAFGVVRDLIFKHTSYSESISITALPLYYLEPNIRIEVEDKKSNIYGDYIIKSMSLPLTHEGTMSISAVRATNRL